MLGKLSAIFEPALMGGSVLLGSARTSILVIVVLFFEGAVLLMRVEDPGAKKGNRPYENNTS
ncbi:MAG: hypothetical protein R8K22_00495 [Mariprofundaceae bacterium]